MSAYIGLVGLLRNLRTTFGAVRSRDVEVRAQQKNIDAAIAMIEAIAAPLPQQAAGDELARLSGKPIAQVILDADGCDDVRWLVDSASGDVQPGDLLYKK